MSIGGRPAIPVTVQQELWALVRSGLVVAEAAESVGVSKTVAWRWFRHVGGVMPEPFRAGRPIVGAGRLSFQEREEISCRRAAGVGVRVTRGVGVCHEPDEAPTARERRAISSASRTMSVRMCDATRQPTMRREGLLHVPVTPELACPRGGPGEIAQCPSQADPTDGIAA